MCLFLWRTNDNRSVCLVCILCPAAKWSYRRSSSCAVRPTNPDGGGRRKTTVRSSSSGSRFPAKRKLVFLDLRVFTSRYFQLHLLRRTHKEDAKVAAKTIQNVSKLRRIQARFQYYIDNILCCTNLPFSVKTFDKHFIFNNLLTKPEHSTPYENAPRSILLNSAKNQPHERKSIRVGFKLRFRWHILYRLHCRLYKQREYIW